MLAGVRCTEQVEECGEYVSLGGKTTDTLQTICRGVGMNAEGTAALRNGATCGASSDCASANCFFPEGSTTGTCQACQSSFDCMGGGIVQSGFCQCTGDPCNGTCMLDLATNQILTPAACSPILPPFPQLPVASAPFDTIGAFASGRRAGAEPPPRARARGSSCRSGATRPSPGSTSRTIACRA